MKDKFLVETFLSDEFNLSRKEITLYLNLVRHRTMTILELADVSNMNRSTTHVNVDSLTQKGLVTQLKKGRGSRRLIMAEPVDKLSLILKNKKAKLEAAEEQLPRVAEEIMSLKEESALGNNIEIRHYKGKDEVSLIYEDIMKAKEIRTYANITEIAKVFPNNMDKFLNAHKKDPDMHIWEIMEDSEKTREYLKQKPSERLFCRLTTKKLKLSSMDYILFDGRVAVIDANNGISGVVIENDNLYSNEKAIHSFVWDSLPKNYE